jgi:hypothetical protein
MRKRDQAFVEPLSRLARGVTLADAMKISAAKPTYGDMVSDAALFLKAESKLRVAEIAALMREGR